MNFEEKIAEKFLKDIGFTKVCYEPRGKSTPPDFLVAGKIGIEVRRLNKHIDVNGIKTPLEKLNYQFIPKFKRLLLEMDNPNLQFSIGITLRFERPIKVSNKLMLELKESILTSTSKEKFGKEIQFNNQISYELYKGNGKSDHTYELIIQSDRDRGGIVQVARYDAAKICIREKSEKLEKIKDDFSEFWLILIDDIYSRVNSRTKQDFEIYPKIESLFKRIIIISKRDPSQWIDLYS